MEIPTPFVYINKKVSDEKNITTTIEERINYLKNIITGNIKLKAGQINILSKPCDIQGRVIEIGGSMTQIGKGTYGKVMKVCIDDPCDYKFVLKETQYSDDDEDINYYNPHRGENVESTIFKKLNDLVTIKATPHIPIYMGDFDCDIGVNHYKYIITEVYDGSLFRFLRNPKNVNNNLDKILKTFIFQVLYTLKIIHKKYPTFMHNDLKVENVLYRLNKNYNPDNHEYYRYILDGNEYMTPNVGSIAIWDFGISSIVGENADNNLTEFLGRNNHSIQSEFNGFLDIFFFLRTLMIVFNSDRWLRGAAPNTLKFCNKYTKDIPTNWDRLAKNIEYHTIDEMLSDDYFDELRNNKPNNIIETYSDYLVESKDLSNLNPFPGIDLQYSERKFICSDYQDLYYISYKDTKLNDPHRVNCNKSSITFNNDYVKSFSEVYPFYDEHELSKISRDSHTIEKVINLYEYIFETYIQRMNVPIHMLDDLGLVILDKVSFYVTNSRKFSLDDYTNLINTMSTKQALDLIIQFNNYSYHYGIDKMLYLIYSLD